MDMWSKKRASNKQSIVPILPLADESQSPSFPLSILLALSPTLLSIRTCTISPILSSATAAAVAVWLLPLSPNELPEPKWSKWGGESERGRRRGTTTTKKTTLPNEARTNERTNERAKSQERSRKGRKEGAAQLSEGARRKQGGRGREGRPSRTNRQMARTDGAKKDRKGERESRAVTECEGHVTP